MRKLLIIAIAVLGLFESTSSMAVPVRARFKFFAEHVMAQFFGLHPVFVVYRYITDDRSVHELPNPILVDENFQPTTPVLDLGDINPGQDFSIRFLGEYMALNRAPGMPQVPIPARVRLDLTLVQTAQGTLRIRRRHTWARNDSDQHPLPQAEQIRAISPYIRGVDVGAAEVDLGGEPLHIGLDFGADNAVLPAMMNELL